MQSSGSALACRGRLGTLGLGFRGQWGLRVTPKFFVGLVLGLSTLLYSAVPPDVAEQGSPKKMTLFIPSYLLHERRVPALPKP